MGAWGNSPFQNDDAEDWLDDLAEISIERRRKKIRKVIEKALTQRRDLDEIECSVAIAAAALVAISTSNSPTGVLAELDPDGASREISPSELEIDPTLVVSARDVVLRATSDSSELAAIWAEQGEEVPEQIQRLLTILSESH